MAADNTLAIDNNLQLLVRLCEALQLISVSDL